MATADTCSSQYTCNSSSKARIYNKKQLAKTLGEFLKLRAVLQAKIKKRAKP